MKTNRSIRVAVAGLALAGAGVAGSARAVSVSAVAGVSGSVNARFSITLDVATVSFGFVDPGTTTDLLAANVANCRTNRGLPWFLKVRYLAPVLDATLATRSAGGAGINQAAFTELTVGDQTTYTSAVSEERNLPWGTDIAIDYSMVADANSAPGLKSWVVSYTLTETL